MRIKRGAWACFLAVGIAVPIVPSLSAQDTSTSEERAQWVAITHKLESNPLDDSMDKQGEVALNQISSAHDIHVPLCPVLLGGFSGMKYAYAHTIMRQYMLASTAFLIENPEKISDHNAMNLAAVESVLKAYTSIIQQRPDSRAQNLDNLLQKQKEERLVEYIQKSCSQRHEAAMKRYQ
ncbi:MAG TPA: hypothetical protein VGN44_09585 [Candidatus Angelobacter sp.]|jgi:hypothetical protein